MTPKNDAERLHRIETTVRASICPTFGIVGGLPQERIEGRISGDDFEWLIQLVHRIRRDETEACAALFESVNAASDDERYHGDAGAGAMGAVLEFRDLIRARATGGAS